MKIREIRVDGYGALRDRSYMLEGPVTVFHGPNEAGKSTLLQLIRAVLFGFPARGQAADRLEPVGGGAHGGALTLETLQGERVRVARRAADSAGGRGRAPSAGLVTVTLADGTACGEAFLQELLGGVSGEQFRNLFAFTLTELMELATLTTEELGGFLHSAGLGVRAQAVTEAERRLAQELEARFKPRGRNQGIGRLLAEADGLEAAWRRSLSAAGRFNSMAEELAQLTARIGAAEEQAAALRHKLMFLQSAHQLQERWHRRQTVLEARARLHPRTSFPEEGLARQEKLLQELEGGRKQLDLLTARRDEYEQTVKAFRPGDIQLYESRGLLEELLEALPVYRSGMVQEAQWLEEIRQVDGNLRQKLQELGITEWGGGTYGELPVVTLQHREQADGWKLQWEELERIRRQLDGGIKEAEQLLTQAEERTAVRLNRLEACRRQLAGRYPADMERWAGELPGYIRELRRDAQEVAELSRELKHVEERELEHRLQVEQLQAQSGWSGSGANGQGEAGSGAVRGWGIFLLLVAFAGGVLFGLRGEWLLAVGCLAALGAPGASLMFLSGAAAKKPKGRGTAKRTSRADRPLAVDGNRGGDEQALFESTTKASSPLRDKRIELARQLEARISRASARQAPFAGRLEQSSAWSGSPLTVSWKEAGTDAMETVEQMERWYAAWLDDSQELQQLQVKMEEAELGEATARQQLERLKVEGNQNGDELEGLSVRWSQWLAQWGAGVGSITPSFAPELVLRLTQAKELEERHRMLHNRLRQLREEREQFIGRVCEWADPDHPAKMALDPAALLQQRKLAMVAVTEAFKRMQEASEALPALLQEQKLLEEQNQRLSQRLAALWQGAGAGGEEEFRRFAAEQAEAAQLDRELAALTELLAAGVGSSRLAELDDWLIRGEGELVQTLAETELLLSSTAHSLDQLKEQKGRLAAESAKLLEGSEHGGLRERQEELLARLRDEASQWAIYAMAAGLLRQARETYERDRQPGVLRQASVHFARMTGGRYERIVAPVGQQRLLAIKPDGEPIDSARLSRGTAEQMYLALRFALAAEFARRTPLPLILDDIFVNFDRVRLQAAVQELAVLAENHQILVFTCHSHVLEAIRQALPTVQTIEV